MPRSRNWRTKLAVLLASLIVSLIGAESYARLRYEPTLDPSSIEAWDDFEFEPPLNKLGYREGPLSRAIKSNRTKRILFLGDSFTFGQGVPKGDDRFSDIIERRLNEDATDPNQRFHVYNAGIPGTNPTHWVTSIGPLLRQYRPDHVVAVFFLRDGTLLGTSLRFYQEQIDQIRAKHAQSRVYQWSYLARTILDRRIDEEFRVWYIDQFQQAYLGTKPQKEVWRLVKRDLLEIRRMCRFEGIPFDIVIFPLLIDLEDYAFHDIERVIETFAERNDIPVFSLTDGFLGQDASDLWVSRSDQHPNERGHAIAAETLYPFLKERLEADPEPAAKNREGRRNRKAPRRDPRDR